MELLSIAKAANLLGVSQQTLRNWEKEGRVVPERTSVKGHRRYSREQIDKLRQKQMFDEPIILPNITPPKLKAMLDNLLAPFLPEENITLTISKDHLNRKVLFSIDSADGLTSAARSFKMED